MKVFNRRDKKEFRSKLRNNLTEPEQLLWNRIRAKQLLDVKFRRQHSIGPYIVDFFCPEKKLVIEIDGESHYQNNQEKLDEQRTRFINKQGIKLIRFTNLDITQNMDGVLGSIISTITGNPS